MLHNFVMIAVLLLGVASAEPLPSPTKVKVSERMKSSFTISWEQPPSQVYHTFTVKISPSADVDENPGLLSRTFTGLHPGVEYVVTVQGFTADGLASRPLRYPVWTVPEEPTGLSLAPVHEIAISISIMGMKTQFTATVDGMEVTWKEGDTAVTGHDLQILPPEGVAVSSGDDDASETSKRIITGLTPGKEYSIFLRSRVGPEFDPVFSLPVRGQMVMPPATPYSAEVVEADPTSVLLKTHGPLEGLHDDMLFDLRPNHGSIGQPTPDPIYPMFDLYRWHGLKPGTSYTLDIYAVSQGVRGYEPKTLTFTTLPGAPVRLRVEDFDHFSVTLQWGHPHKFSDFDEVQYLIEFFVVPDGPAQVATVKNFKFDQPILVQVQRLIPGSIYDFRVYTVLNGIKGKISADVIQTTIPMKPTVSNITVGATEGIELVFGKPEQGECPDVKTFYSPGLNGIAIKPEFHKLGKKVVFPEFPIDGQHKVHARCVSQNVEGPELLITLPTGGGGDLGKKNPRNDVPDGRTELPCTSLIPGSVRPDTIAPDACCNERPYNSEQKECCGAALLQKGGERLCCGESPYNKRFFICCSSSGGLTVELKRDGCPAVSR